MNKHTRFVFVVSSAVAAQEAVFGVQRLLQGKSGADVRIHDGISYVAHATEIDEHAIPDNVEMAARQYLYYVMGFEPAPEWYVTWRDAKGLPW